MTLVFECFDTVRFQVQEMARAEKIISDEAIQTELDIYNRLLPGERELSATLLIELTSDGAMREWLPRLVGIERRIGVSIGRDVVVSVPEAEHAAALTREDVTPAVHYLRFRLHRGPGGGLQRTHPRSALVATHPDYEARTPNSRLPCAPSCSVTSGGQQSPPYRLTRDNSVRVSLHTLRT